MCGGDKAVGEGWGMVVTRKAAVSHTLGCGKRWEIQHSFSSMAYYSLLSVFMCIKLLH